MSDEHTSSSGTVRSAFLGLSVALACIAIALCSIPFVPPNSTLVVPVVVFSFLVLLGSSIGGTAWSAPRLIAAVFVIGVNLFALKLALTGHHLIDWLEGH